jgi:hypothetical protein
MSIRKPGKGRLLRMLKVLTEVDELKTSGLTGERLEDYLALRAVAQHAILSALKDGDKGGKHPPGSWRKESVPEQLYHIDAHVKNHCIEFLLAHVNGRAAVSDEDHLTHILCRAAISIALDSRPREKSNG